MKQAIFRWRGGDPRLFREIYQHYNTVPGTIAEKLLVDSWRSGPPLIEMVNRVFGGAAELAALFPDAGPAWSAEWQSHVSAKPEHGGQAALLHGADEPARAAIVLQLLAEIQPLQRGLSCAVLGADERGGGGELAGSSPARGRLAGRGGIRICRSASTIRWGRRSSPSSRRRPIPATGWPARPPAPDAARGTPGGGRAG